MVAGVVCTLPISFGNGETRVGGEIKNRSRFSVPSSLRHCISLHKSRSRSSLAPLSLEHRRCSVVASVSSQSSPSTSSSDSASPFSSAPFAKKLFVSGLSFRTTEETLRNAFENFGQLVEVNLVMDKIANRPRGFAFLRYATDEESQIAIEGMHDKFLDGRVIFVEVAKPISEFRPRQNPRQY